MSKLYVAEVEDAVAYFLGYWEERRAPPDAALGRARRLLNQADRLVEPPSEEVQIRLDDLYGYLIWGRSILAAAFLDPKLLGLERQRSRTAKTACR